jgi:hypothetical protein
MKIIFRVLFFIGLGVLIWLIVWSYLMAQSFGWTPPDVSLKLNYKEMKWVKKVENKYGCTFDYIGLDDGVTEDSNYLYESKLSL